MVVLVTGANGQLGQALQFVAHHYPELQFVFCSSTQLDITNKTSCQAAFEQHQPKYCINAAAYTAVDKAESEPEKAHLINVIGAKNLAEVCLEFGACLLHVSTDFVFDGTKLKPYTEEDTTNPLNVYGQTKLEGENCIKEVLKNHYIVRTSWVYSQFGANFMKTMLRLAQERDVISVVNDQIGCPTHAVDLAKTLLAIVYKDNQQISDKLYGIYNYSGSEVLSWYNFAKKIFKENNCSINVIPITTKEYPTPAKRPSYSVLDNSKILKNILS